LKIDDIELLEGTLQHTLAGVNELIEGFPVELRRDVNSGRILITAWNEGHNAMTQIDLFDLLEWLRSGPAIGRTKDGFSLPMIG
jgi:hypothetical protein